MLWLHYCFTVFSNLDNPAYLEKQIVLPHSVQQILGNPPSIGNKNFVTIRSPGSRCLEHKHNRRSCCNTFFLELIKIVLDVFNNITGEVHITLHYGHMKHNITRLLEQVNLDSSLVEKLWYLIKISIHFFSHIKPSACSVRTFSIGSQQ